MNDFHPYDDVDVDVGDDVVHNMLLIMLDMMLTMSSMTTQAQLGLPRHACMYMPKIAQVQVQDNIC